MLPVGSPKANWSQVSGQTKYGSKYPMENRSGERPCPEEAWGPRLEPGLDGGPVSERLVAGSATGPGQAQPERALRHFSLPHPVDPPSAGEGGRVQCYMGGSGVDGPWRPRPWLQRLTLGMWNVTSLGGGKEPELVQVVECYRLDLVGLTSTHSVGSGSKLLG